MNQEQRKWFKELKINDQEHLIAAAISYHITGGHRSFAHDQGRLYNWTWQRSNLFVGKYEVLIVIISDNMNDLLLKACKGAD